MLQRARAKSRCLLATECHRIYPTTAKSHGLAIGPTLRLFFGVFGGLHLHRVIAFDVILVLRRGITTSSLSLRLLLCFQLITWHWDKSGSCVSRLNQTSGNPSRASQTVYLGFFKFNIPYWILERMLDSGFGLVCFFPFSWMCFFFTKVPQICSSKTQSCFTLMTPEGCPAQVFYM